MEPKCGPQSWVWVAALPWRGWVTPDAPWLSPQFCTVKWDDCPRWSRVVYSVSAPAVRGSLQYPCTESCYCSCQCPMHHDTPEGNSGPGFPGACSSLSAQGQTSHYLFRVVINPQWTHWNELADIRTLILLAGYIGAQAVRDLVPYLDYLGKKWQLLVLCSQTPKAGMYFMLEGITYSFRCFASSRSPCKNIPYLEIFFQTEIEIEWYLLPFVWSTDSPLPPPLPRKEKQ